MPDAPLQESLDRITRLATRLLGVPMAFARLYDAGYHRYHTSYVGLQPEQQHLCATLLQASLFSGDVRKVENVYLHAATPAGDGADGPLPDAVPPLCSYLLVPLRTAEGTTLGALGVFDTQPRTFTPAQQQSLDDLARTVADVASWMPIASARRAREENWRDIVERNPDPVLIVVEMRIAYANAAAATLCGAPSAVDLAGRSFLDFIAPALHDALRQRLALLERGEVLPPLAHAWIRLHGEQRFVEAHSGLVRFAGQPAVQIAFRDITAQREAEERLRALVQNASDIIAVIDQEGLVRYESPSLERILGYPAGSLQGRPVLSLVHPEDVRRIRARTASLHRDPDQIIMVQGRFAHAEGPWVYLEGTCRNLLDTPAVGGYVVNVRDVTERQQYEEELHTAKEYAEEMLRLKSAFLANMSHEIRTPLTGILGLAQILTEEVPSHLQEFIHAINHSGRRLLETLTALLELSRLESGSFELHPSSFDLVEELRHSLELFEGQVHDRNLDLLLETPIPTLPIRMDRGVLNSLLQNLVSNAIKFTEEGQITVAVEQHGPDAILRVQDTGIGISDGFLPHIFDEFKQESDGMGREYEGAGLGLTLVRGMLDLMSGRIEVQTRKGYGSTFTVHLPGVVDQVKPPPGVVDQVKPPHGVVKAPLERPAHVLVVEDNEATQTFIHFALRKLCQTAIAGEANEARAAWQQTRPDLVLMDINLGAGKGMGIELLKELRSNPATAAIPVVAMTAYALPGDRERFLNEGFDAYLSKPFTKDQLLDLLGRMLPEPLRPPPPPRTP